MNFEINTVYTIKLNSGEELIAKITEVQDNFIIITDPVSVAPGQQGVGLIPSMFTADPDKPVTLNTNNIAFYAHTEDSVKMKYIQATTGITVPEKKIILG